MSNNHPIPSVHRHKNHSSQDTSSGRGYSRGGWDNYPLQPQADHNQDAVGAILPPRDNPIIIQNFEDELVEEKLLRHLAAMTKTLRVSGDKDAPWTREDKIRSMMCRELLTVGYSTIRRKMDQGDRPLGELHYGSALQIVKIGPVCEFIAPDEEVECMWCWNQKAIELMERYPDFELFYGVWNGVLDRCVKNKEWDALIFVREYRSIDHGEKQKYSENPSTSILTLNRDTLRMLYERASERVEALRRIDELKDGFRAEIRNRNVRRRLV